MSRPPSSISVLPWFARSILGLFLGRLLLPYVFGKSYKESKHAFSSWISATADHLIPPPGVDETRAGEGIMNAITAGKKEQRDFMFWKPQVGVLLIKGVRAGLKYVLGV